MNELKQQCAATCSQLKIIAKTHGKQLTFSVTPAAFTGKIAAVDSGFSAKQFVSLDVMLLRSVATVFAYADNNLLDAQYFPSRVPGIALHYGVFPDASDSACFKTLCRLNAELTCALQTVKIHQPALLFLDGSIMPLPSDKPSKDSTLEQSYRDVIQLYNQLFETCKETNCQVVGIVKDSRSFKFSTLLKATLPIDLKQTNDEFLVNTLLEPGQRTTVFPLVQHEDIGQTSSAKCFYLKAGPALPYRVEFLCKENVDVEQTATQLAAQLTSLSTQFAYPSILIEADMRAALTPGEINSLFSSLENNSREFILRSNSRPFRQHTSIR